MSEFETTPRKIWRVPKVGTLLIVAGLLLGAALFLSIWLPARRQAHAVEAVTRFGGYVVYDEGFEVSSYRAGRPAGPEWLWSFVDPNLFYDVVEVRLYAHSSSADDVGRELFPHLASLRRVQTISISDANVSNEDLRWVSDLPELRAMYLQQTEITEEHLNHLQGLKLDWLCLARTWAGDDSLASLSDMTTLEYLDLTRTRVTDAGLVHLERLPNLKRLILRRCRVTEEGAAAIRAKLPGCEVTWEPLDRRTATRSR